MAGAVPSNFTFGAAKTPASAAANYLANAQGKGTWWATRYLSAKVNPFAAAAAAASYWLQRVNEAGTASFVKGLNGVDLAAVAKTVSTAGPGLYSTGITTKGAPKYAKSAVGLIPALQAAAAALPPRGTIEQNIARSAAMQRAAAAMRGMYRAHA